MLVCALLVSFRFISPFSPSFNEPVNWCARFQNSAAEVDEICVPTFRVSVLLPSSNLDLLTLVDGSIGCPKRLHEITTGTA